MAARYVFDRFELDPSNAELRRDGSTIEAQPKVLDALAYFVANPGRLLTKDELMQRLWPDVTVGEESLTQVVRKLRVALDDDPQRPRFLQTVPRRGYRFLPAVVLSDGEEGPAAPATIPRPRHRPVLLGAAAGLAVVAVAGWLAGSRVPPAPAAPLHSTRWRERRLTSTPERETFPALAPDGERYAYVRPFPTGGPLELFAASLDGATTRLTATEADELAPRFSPDGRWILYTRHDRQGFSVFCVPSLGGTPERWVEDGGWGTWSPDGEAIAYLRRGPGGRTAARRLRRAAGEDVELWSVDGPLESAAWSPGGLLIAAVGDGQIWVGAAEVGAAPRVIDRRAVYVRSVAWDPAGGGLVTDGRWPGLEGNIVRLPLGGGEPTPVTQGANGLFDPSVSRDGNRLLYAAEHKVRQLWRFDEERRPIEALPLPESIECFDVAPDGSSLAATDWQPLPGRSTLVLFELPGGAARSLGDGLCPAFSPDGRRLAYLGHQAGDLGLWTLDLASGERRRVAADRGAVGLSEDNAARRPAWSPDTRRLAYEGMGLPEGDGIFVLDLAAGTTRLLAPRVFGNLAWSPDGRWLAVGGAGPGPGNTLIELATGEARRASPEALYRAGPVWLTGGRVAFLSGAPAQPVQIAVEPASLVADTPAPFTTPPDASFWGLFDAQPDRRGGWIVVIERYESDLYLLERGP